MSIFKNAVDSIELGIEDFRTNNPKRLISSVRNIFAGVLLLLKHKLERLSGNSENSLVLKAVIPKIVDGKMQSERKGDSDKTVDFKEIKQRFKIFGIQVDWESLGKVQDYRNKIEHSSVPKGIQPEVVRGYVLDCFNITRDFMRTYLEIEPQSQFDPEIWKFCMEEEKIYAPEAAYCFTLWRQISWTNNTAKKHIENSICSDCYSPLIKPIIPIKSDIEGMSFQCANCGKRWEYEDLLILACKQEERRNYYDPHDCDISQFFECPECYMETYDAHENQCVNCGAKGPYTCDRCLKDIPPEELSIGDGELCSYCYNLIDEDD